MSSLALWLCTVLLLGSGMAADIPCGYNETGFHKIRAPDVSPEQIQTVTLSALSQYPGAILAVVPRLSEPVIEVKSNIDLINDAVDPENTITRNKAVEIAADAPGPLNIDQICYIYKYVRDNWEYVSDPRGIDYISSGNNTIKSVKYSLHQTFEKPEHISTDASKNFEMIMWSWGRFVMPITFTTVDGNEYEYMYPFTFRSLLENAQRSGIRFIDATSSWDVIGGY